jgi:hypothetical protein
MVIGFRISVGAFFAAALLDDEDCSDMERGRYSSELAGVSADV